MKIMAILIAVLALVSGANALDNASNSTAATMAVADPSRPDSDTTRDADRKPAQTLMFVGIKSGDKVADYVADAGYLCCARGWGVLSMSRYVFCIRSSFFVSTTMELLLYCALPVA